MENMPSHYYIIFGAAVKPDGSPSGTLARRVRGAWQLSLRSSQAKFIVTGGQGEHGPTEAQVMKALLLDRGVGEQQIILEENGQDTLQSVLNCARILREQGDDVQAVIICSSPYHNYRCQMLFKMLGIKCQRGEMPSDRPALGLRKWLYYYLREAVAAPWDCLQMYFLRLVRSR
jgi:vancomycin permeability regulator SanA